MKNTLLYKNYALIQLTKRNILLYFKDKATVFFSFLAPLIILMLYVLFLGRVQINSIEAAVPQGLEVDGKLIRIFIDSWMLAGVMSVTCITVPLNAMAVMVGDKQGKQLCDFSAAPISNSVVMLSYFLAAFCVTLIIVFAVLAIGMIYLWATGGFLLAFVDVLGLFAAAVLSALSATFVVMLIASFVATQSALGALGGIVSALIGFAIGAYMPIDTFPQIMQNIVCFVPGTYSAGMFRNLFMHNALSQMPDEFAAALAKTYSVNLNLFGAEIGLGGMCIILAATIPLFLGLNLLRFRHKPK